MTPKKKNLTRPDDPTGVTRRPCKQCGLEVIIVKARANEEALYLDFRKTIIWQIGPDGKAFAVAGHDRHDLTCEVFARKMGHRVHRQEPASRGAI